VKFSKIREFGVLQLLLGDWLQIDIKLYIIIYNLFLVVVLLVLVFTLLSY